MMKTLAAALFALIPLLIGLGAIGLLTGKLVIRERTGAVRPITGIFRLSLWGCAILSTLAGVSFFLMLIFAPQPLS